MQTFDSDEVMGGVRRVVSESHSESMEDVPRRLSPVVGRSSTHSSLSDYSSGEGGLIPQKDLLAMAADDAVVTTSPLRVSRNLHRMGSYSSSGSMRGGGARSENSSADWGYGWYEDDDNNDKNRSNEKRKRPGLVPQLSENRDFVVQLQDEARQGPGAMAVTAPTYVLEESLSSQKLWKYTAGNRPPQPVEERAFFEKMWAQNFERSKVNYGMPVEVLTATSPVSLNPFAEAYDEAGAPTPSDFDPSASEGAAAEATLVSLMNNEQGLIKNEPHDVLPKTVQGSEGDLTILIRGDNNYGTTVSKSFSRPTERGSAAIETINISIASYRVVENRDRAKYAQFLVIYREGSIRDTIGVWKRYRDFEELANKVTQAHEGCASVIANVSPLSVTEDTETEHLPNAITSWRLLKKRQRWFRCLDSGYLSLKVFLLERFLHDILFESTSPKLLREFVVGEKTL